MLWMVRSDNQAAECKVVACASIDAVVVQGAERPRAKPAGLLSHDVSTRHSRLLVPGLFPAPYRDDKRSWNGGQDCMLR